MSRCHSVRLVPNMLATRWTFKFQGQLLNPAISSGKFEHLLESAVVDVTEILMAPVKLLQDLLLFSRFPLVLFSNSRLVTLFFIRYLSFSCVLICCRRWLLSSESTS